MPVGPVSRPRWRYLWFGLRGLIILVLVLGCWLVWIIHLAQVQREAVAEIVNDGGTVRCRVSARNNMRPARLVKKPSVFRLGGRGLVS
jgi:hypothetical protein